MARAQRSAMQIAESDANPDHDADGPLQSGGGGGTMDGMNERVIRLEERTDLFGKQLDRIVTRLDAMDEKLGTRFDFVNEKLSSLPSKEFLTGSIIGALAIALAVASLTFVIADYAASRAVPQSVTQAPAPSAPPMIIVVPSLATGSPTIVPAPVAPQTPTP